VCGSRQKAGEIVNMKANEENRKKEEKEKYTRKEKKNGKGEREDILRRETQEKVKKLR
jgi:hypothetical protein